MSDNGQKQRELSWLVAAVLFSCVLSLLIGYFIGYRAATSSFVDLTKTELTNAIVDEAALLPVENHDSLQSVSATEQLLPVTVHAETGTSAMTVPEPYYALIATVDSYAAATNLAARAAKLGVQLRIKKALRKLSRGRHKHTYQLITPPYESRDKLSHDLSVLKAAKVFAKIDDNCAIKQGKWNV